MVRRAPPPQHSHRQSSDYDDTNCRGCLGWTTCCSLVDPKQKRPLSLLLGVLLEQGGKSKTMQALRAYDLLKCSCTRCNSLRQARRCGPVKLTAGQLHRYPVEHVDYCPLFLNLYMATTPLLLPPTFDVISTRWLASRVCLPRPFGAVAPIVC